MLQLAKNSWYIITLPNISVSPTLTTYYILFLHNDIARKRRWHLSSEDERAQQLLCMHSMSIATEIFYLVLNWLIDNYFNLLKNMIPFSSAIIFVIFTILIAYSLLANSLIEMITIKILWLLFFIFSFTMMWLSEDFLFNYVNLFLMWFSKLDWNSKRFSVILQIFHNCILSAVKFIY